MRLAVAAVILALAAGASVAARGGTAACGWTIALDRPGAQLFGVAALSDKNVWAVGMTADRGAILHWDGHGWWQTLAPILPLDVAAASSKDVWVVGSSAPTAVLSRAESEHWDGVRWTVAPVPGGLGAYLRGVSTRSSGVWAVGAGHGGPLAVRWTGRAWKSVLTPPSDGLLHAADGLWAVGTQGQTGQTGSADPLVERLSSRRWRPVRTPSFNTVDEDLVDVSAVSARNVWAVGSAAFRGGRSPLVQHMQGRVWRDESVEGLPEANAALLAVVAFGQDDAWTAGYRGSAPQRTLLAHWNGKQWTQVPGGRTGTIWALSALSSHDIWAVGGTPSRSLIERYSCS